MTVSSGWCPNQLRGSARRAAVANEEQLRERVLRLLRQEIDFLPHGSFREPDAEREILGHEASAGECEPAHDSPRDMPAHLARLCDAELLTAAEEVDLFRRMNYLKFRANSLRCRLDPRQVDEPSLVAAEQYLAQARQIRDRLVRANMRLVISIVKKFVTPQQSFDELLSEGSMSLLQAVEKFDFSRGFRFSTYAYRAVARNAFRKLTERQKEMARYVTGADESIFRSVCDEGRSPVDDRTRQRFRQWLAAYVHRLDRRERFIIRCRYALGAHRTPRTFQDLADKLGISKERVRQLEQRAVAKLRGMAAEAGVGDPAAVAGGS
ncbi:MAG: sigma-70 family RNA polymerase sigma factor [Pirellulaceae bacterium]|nr:sigma-70 family RNA polymerase sigma factor [Pirellulaceae bacterium]